MVTWTRHVNTPKEYDLQPPGRATIQDKIYVGFVKYADDVNAMGRLKVWIPELGGDPNDPNGWFIMSYCSPFAGATNVLDNKNDNSFPSTQKSYGMWFVPPDLNNEVVCAFINGDPGRGIWFGCLYQQNMNQMVPGLPGNNSQATLPTAEYNKKITQPNLGVPDRPLYYPLADQLKQQGLAQDTLRGVSNSGARRVDPGLAVYGWLTPAGSQLVYDDDPANTYIRFRTPSGAQIIINDTTGFIYLNSVDGKNWISMDAGGRIDVYGYGDISIRSQGSLNLRADQDVNIEAGQNINMRARGTTAITPVVNPQANNPQPAPPVPGPAAMIGDATAAALAQRIPGSTPIANPGSTSSDNLVAVQDNAGTISGIVNGVISVGATDTDQALLLDNITGIRSALSASNYVWILPYNTTSAATIQTFATSKGDQVLPLSNYPSNDNIIPRDYNIVTNDLTPKLKPANPDSNSPVQTGSTGSIPTTPTSTQPQSGSNVISTSNITTATTTSGSPAPVPATPASSLPGSTVPAASTTSTSVGNTAPAGTTVTSVLVPFLQQVEGKDNKAYWDAQNQRVLISIGYGHQIKPNEYAQGYIDTGTAGRIPVTRPNSSSNPPGNATATDEQCLALLNIDVQIYIAGAHTQLGGAWDVLGPYQQAALSSVYYNSPATLKRLVGQGLTNYITSNDLQGAATLIANAGPAIVASRRVKESNLYLQRTDLLGSGGDNALPGQPSGGANNTVPGTGDSQNAPGTIATSNPNINNGFIKIQSTNSMHLLANQYMFLTAGADMHRFAGSNMFDTAGTNWNRAAGGFVHESVGQDFSVGASSEINLSATRIDLNGTQPPLAVAAVAAQGPNDINQQDGILDTLGNVIPVLTDTIVYHLPYHEPYDDHGGRNTYGIQNATSYNTNTGLRAGEVVQNSQKPLNLIGTPLSNMPPGIYTGAGYNIQNQPVYAYQGPISNSAIQTTSGLQLSQAGTQFMEGFENGSYIPIVVGEPPVTQIGYGHNLTPVEISTGQVSINGSSYSLYSPLSQQLIDQLFQQDMVAVQNWMRPVVNVSVTQTQYDMLCSLAFNIGQTNFTNAPVIKELVAGNVQNVPNLWMQWTLNGANKLVPQLVQRRLAESTNFMLAPFQQTVPAQNTNVITSNFSNTGTGKVTPLVPNQ
jgi:GH24 family phage-related lysozyme (muramidase)